MTEEKFKAGDIVTLKSGGTNMTVKKYFFDPREMEDEGVICVWNENGISSEESYPEELLIKV